MTSTEFVTRAAIWIALACYFAATIARLIPSAGNEKLTRWLWTFGCLAYVAHVFCAFQFYHSWSHEAATVDTARQTAEVTGWNWGGGIWFNYLFTVIWIADVARLWRSRSAAPSRRLRIFLASWQAFFFFMVVNATAVFETGPVRSLGAAGCLAVATLFIRSRRKTNQGLRPERREMAE